MNLTINAGVKVLWRNKEYITGNRRCGQVELYRDSKFVRVVSIKSVIKREPLNIDMWDILGAGI
jgi:hypothetical protein